MSINHAKLVGLSRPIPDVLTFVTPIFFDEEAGYLIQKSTNGRVSEFQKTFIGAEFEKIEINIISMKNDFELFGFEYAQDHFVFGYKEQLIGILQEFNNKKKGYEFTKASINNFIKSSHTRNYEFFISPHLFHIYKCKKRNKWSAEVVHEGLPFLSSIELCESSEKNNAANENHGIFNPIYTNPVIKVIGIGGCGGNVVKHMITKKIEGLEFICANTDSKALADIDVRATLHLGRRTTQGAGAGANPEIGRLAAIEDREHIAKILHGADIIFIVAGMGGGTGTGASPVVAEIARDLGILTVALVTQPFPFEGRKRMVIANAGIQELSEHVDSLITIPNEQLLSMLGKSTSLLDAFKTANNILHRAIQSITDPILYPGIINVDFADIRSVISKVGMTMMGTGRSNGKNRAREAAETAIYNPLLGGLNLQNAQGILVNITAGDNLTLGEYSEVGSIIEEFASGDTTVVIGTVITPEPTNELSVTIIATGLNEANKKHSLATTKAKNYLTPVESSSLKYAGSMSANIAALAAPLSEKELEYLDIPAFLRRQTDE